MNIKRIFFWLCFVIVLGLILWGLAVSMTRQISPDGKAPSTPPAVTADDHILGSTSTPVTLIEYSDFQCPACENYYPVITKLMSEASSTVHLVYRHFPLPQHANALSAAIASEAAGAQGKFWEMYDLLFQGHADWTELKDPTPVFIRYAGQLKLDTALFTADLKDKSIYDKVHAQETAGQDIGINQTPTLFVNGKAITTPASYADLKKLILEAATTSTQ